MGRDRLADASLKRSCLNKQIKELQNNNITNYERKLADASLRASMAQRGSLQRALDRIIIIIIMTMISSSSSSSSSSTDTISIGFITITSPIIHMLTTCCYCGINTRLRETGAQQEACSRQGCGRTLLDDLRRRQLHQGVDV